MKTIQSKLITAGCMVLCALVLAGKTTALNAQAPGGHPAYLHAIRDLRDARGLLQYPFKMPEHIKAAAALTTEINDAIGDLKAASHLDDKSLGQPLPNKELDANGRFHRIQELLQSAQGDIKTPESDPAAVPHRDGAMHHIDKALQMLTPVL